MIDSLELHNFESHRHSLFEFVPGVNIFVGVSDAGKTAIARAFRWVRDNRPSGNDFCSWEGVNDGGETSVEIVTNNNTVLRSKGKVELYKVNGLELKAFKTDVPDEVVKALNLNTLNLKTQFESHFLLSISAGDVASHFNRVARLDKIDIATSNINKWIADLTAGIKASNNQIETKTAELKEYDYLEAFEKEVDELEALNNDYNNLQTNITRLKNLTTDIEDLDAQIAEEQNILKAEPLVDELLELYKQRKTVQQSYNTLTKLVDQITETENDLDGYAELLKAEPLVDELLELYKTRRQVSDQQRKLFKLTQSIMDGDQELAEATDKLAELEAEFEAEFPDICPLCGKPK